MPAPFTFHTLAHCKTWPAYHAAYLRWMQKYDSPLLKESNYNASTWHIRHNISVSSSFSSFTQLRK